MGPSFTTLDEFFFRLNPGLDTQVVVQITQANPGATSVATRYFSAAGRSELELVPETPKSVQTLVRRIHTAGGELPALAVCPRCHLRAVIAHRLEDGTIACRTCQSRERVTECGKCGKTKQVARVVAGLPLCKPCAYPNTVRTCSRCGYEGTVCRKIDGLETCLSCVPVEPKQCHQCGVMGKVAAKLLGGPMCFPCYGRMVKNPTACPGCAERRILHNLDANGRAVCAACANVRPRFGCGRCGSEDFYRGPLCATCLIKDILDDLMGSPPRDAALASLREHLLAQPNRYNTHKWLTRAPLRQLFRDVVSGTLPRQHASLAAAKPGVALDYLRRLLMDHGVLPKVDPRVTVLEAWLPRFCSTLHADDRSILVPYATWVVMRRVRSVAQHAPLSEAQLTFAKSQVKRAARFLGWLREHSYPVESLGQVHIDEFQARTQSWADIQRFVRWLNKQHGTRGTVYRQRTADQSPTVSEDRRFSIVLDIYRDKDLPDDVRLICLFVAVFGMKIFATTQLKRQALRFDAPTIGWVSFTEHETELPPWLAQLAYEQLERTHGQWLFPGRWRDGHRSPASIPRYLRKYGVTLRDLQLAARFQLASAMNASMLSDTIGLSAATIINYRRLSGGWWADAIDMFAVARRWHSDEEGAQKTVRETESGSSSYTIKGSAERSSPWNSPAS